MSAPDHVAQDDPAPAGDQWAAVLDRLEHDTDQAELMLTGDPQAVAPMQMWQVPHPPGALPSELFERATALAARQRRVVGELTTRVGSLTRHRALVGDLDPLARPAYRPAVYVDLTA